MWADAKLDRLIAASVGTLVHYGFQCYPHIGHVYLFLSLMTAIAGSVFPFMDWFNQRKYKVGCFLPSRIGI